MSEQLVQISKSSAARTSFVHEAVDVGGGRVLHVDGNSKITAGNGSYEDPRPNALSLVQVEDCPESTPTCRASCYVHGIEEHARDLHDLYRANSRTIREILPHMNAYARAAARFARWIRQNAAGGFRWHVSGDVFGFQYACWIVDVCKMSHDVQHWIYTRRTDGVLLGVLQGARNLTINLSADRDNYVRMRSLAHTMGNLRITYMSTEGEVPDDLLLGSVIFPDYKLRGRDLQDPRDHAWWQGLTQEQRRMVCPVDFFGKSETLRCGPCRKCIAPVGGDA